MVEVVGLHVGDHRDVGVVGEERAVALVGLDDEGRAPTEGGVGAELGDLAPGGERRVGAGGDSPTTSIDVVVVLPLAPATATRRCPPMSDGQGLGPVQHTQVRGPGGGQLDVVVAHGGGDHDGVDVGHVGRVVAEVHAGPAVAQRLQDGRVGGVGPADGQAARQQQPCDGGHAGPADGDEVDPPEQLERAPRVR